MRPLAAGSLYYKIALSMGCVAVFVAVWLTSGGSPPSIPEAANRSAPARRTSPAALAIPSTPVPSQPAAAPVADATPAPEPETVSSREAEVQQTEQRRDAVRKLGAGNEAIPALVDAARNDPDVHTRIIAIDALRRAALAGNHDGAITGVLIEASTSQNAIVVAHARNALDQIQQARGTR